MQKARPSWRVLLLESELCAFKFYLAWLKNLLDYCLLSLKSHPAVSQNLDSRYLKNF